MAETSTAQPPRTGVANPRRTRAAAPKPAPENDRER